ncbi:cAMP-binding domain of CRP or a regulatory subunit of cAMP-dependent protein kinases [Dyadobacter koreensis]|uniref:cAMP-binding domain of CRP or a regulatory subunit of cAMP-dependent protein kinases n=1 Tax=Dyadobacter koreensis TaxID=408657 RepID=A0A1H6XMF8_9BACT|nr:cyclic nucleotide-binding domain-containing protein [Dyadobacter koreensis]SEJ26082.1 cAMP-binding domain of CRP or a regulatory subunit of cAMP-dependent protein kinases [Dyadobacter koreensis]
MDEFIKLLKPSIDLKNINDIRSVSTLINVASPRILLSTLQIQDRIYFIREGVIRRYSIVDGEENTNWFFSKGDFAISEDSFFLDEASEEYLETTGPSLLIEIKKADYLNLINNSPEFKQLVNRLYKKYISGKREYQRVITNPRINSYDWFATNHKYALNHIKLHHLARFLGITKEYLSKLRSQNR